MKLGSVKFFKRVIVFAFTLMVIIPLLTAIIFGVLYGRQKKQSENLAAVNQILINDFVRALDSPEAYLDSLQQAANENQTETDIGPSFSYQTMYPHLYAKRPATQVAVANMCYLTFDDGPSPTTEKILDVLAEEKIKATFFVTGKSSELHPETLKRIVGEGHTIGVHTYSHEYVDIYESVENFLQDFDKMYSAIVEITGVAPQVFRFPGGSINVYNTKTYTAIIAEMTRRGFVFYDWNVAASDAVKGGLSKQQVVQNVLSSAYGYDRIIVLMHDRLENGSTVAALPDIIHSLQDRGFAFAAISNEVEPVTYYYPGEP